MLVIFKHLQLLMSQAINQELGIKSLGVILG